MTVHQFGIKLPAVGFILFGFILLMLFTPACDLLFTKNSVKKRNIICLVDFSASKNDILRQQFYRTTIKEKILQNTEKTDRITILPIDARSVTKSEEILVRDISSVDFTPDLAPPLEEEKIIAQNFEKYKNEMVAEFEKNFDNVVASRKSGSQGTDIFGLLADLPNYIKSDSQTRIIFFSDMMNYSKTLSLEPSNKEFNKTNLEKIVKDAPPVKLANAKIFVLTGEQPELPPEHFELVKSFWTKYFAQQGMELSDYSSVAVSRLDEMMKKSS